MLPLLHPTTLFETPVLDQLSQTPSHGDTKKTPRLVVNDRDVQIFVRLLMSEYATEPQLQKEFWPGQPGSTIGPKKACQRRLKQLTDTGYLRRIDQPVKRGEGSKPYLYALDRAAAHLLIDEMSIDPRDITWKPKPAEENYPYLAHILAVNDVRIAITQACAKTGVVLDYWYTDRDLKLDRALDYATLTSPAGQAHKAAVLPDSVFVLRRADRMALFFVEVDRMTTTVAPTLFERRGWSRKIRTYGQYFQSDAFHTRYAGNTAQVLTITMSTTRLATTKAVTEQVAAGDTRFWFTTVDHLTADILTTNCWHRASRPGLYSILG